jgi:hypothetical protein
MAPVVDPSLQAVCMLLRCCHVPTAEWDLLGVTGFEWQRRTSQLCTFGLPAAVAFCASTGLHPDLVAHLGVVLLGAGPPGAEYSPPTWGEWFETMNMERDLQMDPYHLTMPYPSGGLLLPTTAEGSSCITPCGRCALQRGGVWYQNADVCQQSCCCVFVRGHITPCAVQPLLLAS